MDRKELINTLEQLAVQTEKPHPYVSAVLSTLIGLMYTETEHRLAEIAFVISAEELRILNGNVELRA